MPRTWSVEPWRQESTPEEREREQKTPVAFETDNGRIEPDKGSTVVP